MKKQYPAIVDMSKLYGELRQCGHADEFGNPDCPNKGRYGLFDGPGTLIKAMCQTHAASLKEED